MSDLDILTLEDETTRLFQYQEPFTQGHSDIPDGGGPLLYYWQLAVSVISQKLWPFLLWTYLMFGIVIAEEFSCFFLTLLLLTNRNF
jgi:hypothetical protein